MYADQLYSVTEGGAFPQYGTYNIPQPFKPKKTQVNPAAVAGCIFIPSLINAIVYTAQSSRLEYESPALAGFICGVVLLVVLCMGYMAFNVLRNGGNVIMIGFMFITSLLAWAGGTAFGAANFITNLSPFYDMANLNVYHSVDPSVYNGQQLMDAGVVHFTRDAHLDRRKSVGFKNKEIYCVAPIVNPSKNQTRYDFWAIGIGCCSGHIPDFHCGEYSNQKAKSGLRLMRDDQRQYFRLAVQEAEVMYNISAPHPIFMYWMTEPKSEIDAYEDKGLSNYYLAVIGFFGAQTGLTLLLVAALIYG